MSAKSGSWSCISIEVKGRRVETFRIVRYIMGVRCSGVSVKWGSTVVYIAETSLSATYVY